MRKRFMTERNGGEEWVDLLLLAVAGFMVVTNIGVFCGGLYGPAAVSTRCDDLKEKLNTVRISDLSEEMHMRIGILEAAMGQVNHGQGVGFKIGGTVIDKKMLKLLASKIVALCSAAFPFVLVATVSAKAKERGGDNSICELTEPHNETLAELARVLRRTAMFQDLGACRYSISLAEIFDLELEDDE
jgi:hypothetical protein